ncbi:MAG: hypothetical protein ACOX28_01810 [Bacilli bacterium]|jgi:hypothetical protein
MERKSTLDIIDDKYFKYTIDNLVPFYGYNSLVLCVIDSVFSIASVYKSTINTLERFQSHAGITHDDEYTCIDFLNNYGHMSGEELANEVFKNRQRTSAVNGILKAQAVKEYIETFNKYGINTTEDLMNCKDKDFIQREIQKIKGQGSGITFHYVMMLAGDSNRYKRDRQINVFFEDLLGYGKLTDEELTDAFFEQLAIVNKKYKEIDNLRLLDSVIWGFMSERSQELRKKENNEDK